MGLCVAKVKSDGERIKICPPAGHRFFALNRQYLLLCAACVVQVGMTVGTEQLP